MKYIKAESAKVNTHVVIQFGEHITTSLSKRQSTRTRGCQDKSIGLYYLLVGAIMASFKPFVCLALMSLSRVSILIKTRYNFCLPFTNLKRCSTFTTTTSLWQQNQIIGLNTTVIQFGTMTKCEGTRRVVPKVSASQQKWMILTSWKESVVYAIRSDTIAKTVRIRRLARPHKYCNT